jgi:hypothetical protein
MIQALRAVVHEGRTPDQAYGIFQEHKEGELAGSKESRR